MACGSSRRSAGASPPRSAAALQLGEEAAELLLVLGPGELPLALDDRAAPGGAAEEGLNALGQGRHRGPFAVGACSAVGRAQLSWLAQQCSAVPATASRARRPEHSGCRARVR